MNFESKRTNAPTEAPGPELHDLIEDMVTKFPHSLRSHWRKVALEMTEAGSSVHEQEVLLTDALRRRGEVREPQFRSPRLMSLPVHPKVIAAFEDVERYAAKINEGTWGVILRCKSQWPRDLNGQSFEDKTVVFKVLKTDMPRGISILHNNDLQGEASFLAEAHALSVEHAALRVGVPCPYFFMSHEKRHVLAQEDLEPDAVSVKDLINNKIPLPHTYPLQKAFQHLVSFVDELHGTGMYHRDLREGNIMINLKATADGTESLLYVVDFGRSKHAYSEEGSRIDGLEYLGDHGMVKQVLSTLERYVENDIAEQEAI